MTDLYARRAAFAAFIVAVLGSAGMVFGAAPAWAQTAAAATAADIAELISQAEEKRQEAAQLEFEWRFTKKHLKDAQAALEDGNLAEAEQLARRALREAELAIEQAKTAETVWQIAVPR